MIFSYINFPSWIKPEVVPFLPIRWYAIMYIVAFAVDYVILRVQCKQGTLNGMDSENCLDLVCHVVLGIIIGARIFSCLIYTPQWYYWKHPHLMFWPFIDGEFVGLPGMSYHGGVVGGILGGSVFCIRHKIRILEGCDAIFTGVPLGYTFGRLGNFINGELWGRCTGSSFGIIFPNAQSFSLSKQWVRVAAEKAKIDCTGMFSVNLPRHPSQLYEAFFEGIVLFIILWFIVRPYAKKNKIGAGFTTGWYFTLYAIFRFAIEYVREPDPDMGFIITFGNTNANTALFESFLNISMGQILCALMLIPGIALIVNGCIKNERNK